MPNGQLGQMGKNSAEEFFETIIYMTAYEETRTIIQSFTKDIESPVLREALESSANVLAFSMVMYAVQKQEALIAVIFDKAELLFGILLLGPAQKAYNKLKGMKGTSLFRKMGFFQNSNQENLMTAQMIATHQGFKGISKTSISSTDKGVKSYQMQLDTKNSLYNRESLNMNMGNNMASRYNETLMFKLMTKSFTPQDETLMKKILGRTSTSALSMDDLNHMADFMYVKDSNGKLTGLSQQFMELMNGIGYLHNK